MISLSHFYLCKDNGALAPGKQGARKNSKGGLPTLPTIVLLTTCEWTEVRLFSRMSKVCTDPVHNLCTRRRASKAFYGNRKTTFLAYFHVFAGNHQWAYH